MSKIVSLLRNMPYEKALLKAMEMIKGNNDLENLKDISYAIFSHTDNHNNIMQNTIVERICDIKRFMLEEKIDIKSNKGKTLIKDNKLSKYKEYLVA